MQTMDMQVSPAERHWQQAAEAGELGLWDLRPELETVRHSPQWKLRLGFPDPHSADSTHFWRCRVHPSDLELMLAAMREHARGNRPHYEAVFRLRSNGSGYRRMHSRGLVIEHGDGGRVLRMVGTMLDLSDRPCTPRGGLAEGPRGAMAGSPLALPFHELLLAEPASPQQAAERQRVLGLVDDLLQASIDQLAAASR